MSLDTALLDGPYTTVFDVGAFQGDFARACLAAWPGCTVHSFEPLAGRPPDVLGNPRWSWHRYALGPREEMREMHRCEFVPSSSMLPMAPLHREVFPYTRRHDVVNVEVSTLGQHRKWIMPPALLKLDVQGFELEVMRGGEAALPLFAAVVLETSYAELYHGAPSAADVAQFMGEHGFVWRHRVDEMRHPETGELLQSDELWGR